MKVGELVEELEAPQPRVSDHLRCLAWCGYVQVRREGRNAYYSVADERVLEVLRLGESLLRDNLESIESCDDAEEGC
jgi:DNA-binding transcriptional ArsR family regulator